MRPTTEAANGRHQAHRETGRMLARPIVAELGQRMSGANPEARIEACRAMILAATMQIAKDGDEARAAGIVSYALRMIVPNWNGADLKAAMRAKAERDLAQAMKESAFERES